MKKPYTSGWGHCTKCGTCNGGVCEPAAQTDADETYGQDGTQVYINQSAVSTIQSNYLSSIARPTYVIDCSGISSPASMTLDLSGSSAFYDVQQPSRYAIKFTVSSTSGTLVK